MPVRIAKTIGGPINKPGYMLRSFRNWFISGLLVIAPVGVTVFVINLLIQKLGAPARPFLFSMIKVEKGDQFWLEFGLNVAALIVILLGITMLGRLSQLFVGRFFVNTFERVVDNVPIVRGVYNTVKQIRDTFVQQEKAVFQKTVLVEYPRPGVWVLGFLTGTGKGEPQAVTEANLLNIFVPTTPNPTSGFLLMVPADQVKFLDMSIGDGMKLIISGGAVVPTLPNKETSLEENPMEAEAVDQNKAD